MPYFAFCILNFALAYPSTLFLKMGNPEFGIANPEEQGIFAAFVPVVPVIPAKAGI